MFTNNISTNSPLGNRYGLPSNSMHLKMQIQINSKQFWKTLRIRTAINNRHYCLTGSTRIFDRGKFQLLVRNQCVTDTCKFVTLHYLDRKLIPLDIINKQMSTYADAIKSNLQDGVKKGITPKLGNNHLNDTPNNYENKRKANKHAVKLVQGAQIIQTSHENSMEKFMSNVPLENMISLAARAEKIINSNCLLLTGLPLINEVFTIKKFRSWILPLAQHLNTQLRIQVDMDQLEEYLAQHADGTIQQDGDSCAFPIPIHEAQFKLGGLPLPIPDGLGINTGGPHNNIFHMYQALPSQHNAIASIRSSVEICTMRGLSGNAFEVQAVLAMVYYKIEEYFAPLTKLEVEDFDVILHRRENKRQHLRKQAFEFVITIYCRPHDYTIGMIRELLDLPTGPADICLDWKGEVWPNYFLMSQQGPSMVLLHKTPTICITGINREADSATIITAFMGDNPTFPLNKLLYCWIGPRDEATSPRSLHLVFNDSLPPVVVGVKIASLGAQCLDGDQYDNPSMETLRMVIAGIIAHYQFVNGNSKTNWTPQMRTAWNSKVASIIKGMPTLQKGAQIGITFAGISSWVPPSFSSTTTMSLQDVDNNNRITSSEKMKALEEVILASTTKLARLKERKRANILDMKYDEDEDDDSSYNSSSMSEDLQQQVRPEQATNYDREFIQNLLEEQEKRHQKDIEQILASIKNSNNTETPAIQASVSQTGGSHSNSYHET